MFDCPEILIQYKTRSLESSGKILARSMIELEIIFVRVKIYIRKNKPLTTKIN
jgi:hypothetical protein